MSDIHVPAGNVETPNTPMRGLKDKQEFQGVTPGRRLFWPTLIEPSAELHDMATSFRGKIWLELGFSPFSIMPFASGHDVYLAIDERPWAKSMMDRSHSERVFDVIMSADKRFVSPPEYPVLAEMARLCGDIKTDEQAGIAFFIMSRLSGMSRQHGSFAASIDCSMATGKRAPIHVKHYSLASIYVNPSESSMANTLKEIGKMAIPMADDLHINVNRPMGEHTQKIARSLTKSGFSWSITIPASEKNIARELASAGMVVIKSESVYYATGENDGKTM
jgi:hypothetical protein